MKQPLTVCIVGAVGLLMNLIELVLFQGSGNHSAAGAKCELICNPGYQVIKDGVLRRCRYQMSSESL